MQVQALSSTVRPGTDALYAIWVWFAETTTTGNVTVDIAAQPGKLSPTFTVCPVPGTATCSVGVMAGQSVELEAQVVAPKTSTASLTLTLTATGSSAQAAAAVVASDSVTVNATPTPTPTPTGSTRPPTPTPASTATGAGATLPASTLPPGTLPPGALPPGTVSPGLLPSASLPALPDPAADPGLTFPNVTPAPDPAPAPSAHPIQVADASAQFPLDMRLIGGQIAGLAVLAAAVTIAVARLSIRRQKPQHDKDSS